MREFMKIILFSLFVPCLVWAIIYAVKDDDRWFSRMALSVIIWGFAVLIKELEARK